MLLEQQGMFIDIGTPEDYARAQTLYEVSIRRLYLQSQIQPNDPGPVASGFERETKSMIITRTPLRISFFGGGTDYPIWYREFGGCRSFHHDR